MESAITDFNSMDVPESTIKKHAQMHQSQMACCIVLISHLDIGADVLNKSPLTKCYPTLLYWF